MRYPFKKGDIIKFITDPYYVKVDGALPYYHYLILDNRKWYMYDVVRLEDGAKTYLNKGDASSWATKVA